MISKWTLALLTLALPAAPLATVGADWATRAQSQIAASTNEHRVANGHGKLDLSVSEWPRRPIAPWFNMKRVRVR